MKNPQSNGSPSKFSAEVGLDSVDPVDDYLAQLSDTVKALSREEIWQVVDVLFEAWKDARRIFICGNGGSAATASHMSNDLNKLCAVSGAPRLRALALTDNVPLMTAWGNDSDFDNIFAEQLLNQVEPGDVVIGISTSGNSGNVLRALETAREQGAKTIGLTGDEGGEMKNLVDHCVFIPDENIQRQEDGHLILNHVIASSLRRMIEGTQEKGIPEVETQNEQGKAA